MTYELYEYKTVDIPIHRGRPTIEETANRWVQQGWRPVTVISPTEAFPTYSLLFDRKKEEREDADE